MFTHILAVSVGFVAIILLLSLIVTIISDTVLVLFRIRGRLFCYGAVSCINATFPKFRIKLSDLKKAQKEYGHLIPRGRIEAKDLEQLAHILGAPAMDDAMTERLHGMFHLMERRTSECFKGWVRIVTVSVSLVVAIAMPADSFDIIQRLDRDAALRATLVDLSRTVVESDIQRPDTTMEIAAAALNELAETRSDVPAVICAPRDRTPEEVIAGLCDELAGNAELAEIVQEYRGLVRKLETRARAEANQTVSQASLHLAELVLKPFNYSSDSFASPSSYLGVLVTALLLSLGAPFWFDTLGRLIGMLDRSKKTGRVEAK